MKIELKPIGTIETCFEEKFGVPRQSMMVKTALGKIWLKPEYSHPDTVLHLEGFSHLWVIYLFHKAQNPNHPEPWTPTIVPPRVEAPKKVGVFASRSPHRPNPIGLSVVKLEKMGISQDRIFIEVSGVDILDGSPILDIKPYVPYADLIPDASSGWIQDEIKKYPVSFSSGSADVLDRPELKKLVTEILEWDPRPRSQREQHPLESSASQGKKFAFRLKDLDIHWSIDAPGKIHVFEIRKIKKPVE